MSHVVLCIIQDMIDLLTYKPISTVCLTSAGYILQDAEVNDVRKLREQAARSFGSNRVLAATDLFTLEVHS